MGWAVGGLSGLLLFDSFRRVSWPLAVMMPAVFSFLGGAIGARLGAMSRASRHLRGTKVTSSASARLGRHWARYRRPVALAGVPLGPMDETVHITVLGATGPANSTTLRALMDEAPTRGDRG